jgi:uncharacterized protein with HEPN domain
MPPEAEEERDKAFLFDIVYGVRLAVDYVKAVTREQFDGDPKTQDAVIRRLTIIGEATKRLSAGLRNRHPEIPWQQMAGMRDVIVHEYDDGSTWTRFGTSSAGSSRTCCLSWNESWKPEIGMRSEEGPHDSP